jgi:hypothetical protein
MAYDIKAIREGLAAALQPLVTDGTLTTASPYALTNPMTPCAMVMVGPTKFDEGVETDTLTFTVAVLTGMASEQAAQEAMDALLGRAADSVKALIEADTTLGGVCDEARVTEASAQRPYALDTASGTATAPYLGCEWTVEVLT